MKVVGYMPSWDGDMSDIQYDKLTHINYSFLLPNSDGTLRDIDEPSKLQRLVSLGHAEGVLIQIAIGGWNDGDDSAFEVLAQSAVTRTRFVNNVMSFVETYDLDGVDMDWEYPNPGASADNYELLITELAAALHSEGKILTAAVVALGWTGGGVKSSLFDDFDFLNIMAYDGGGTNGHSPYSYAVSSLNYWLDRGLPAEKAVLGVPYYARPSWQPYRSKINANAANICRDSDGSDFWNGIPTIREKAELARTRAAGVMTWELSQDTHNGTSLLTAMYEAVNGMESSFSCE